jgi:ketosteroid isomerase-like protein
MLPFSPRSFPLRFAVLGLTLLAPAALRASDEADAIRSVLMAQAAEWNRGDIRAFMRAYWQSDQLRFASGGTVTHGWRTTLERYLARYPDRAAMGTLTFTLIDVNVVSGDAAVVFGQWELARTPDHPWGLFTLVLRKIDGVWVITADHTSSAEKQRTPELRPQKPQSQASETKPRD